MTPAFEILARAGSARRGRIATDHGPVDTPAFMPVGTVGSVKAIDQADLLAAGANIHLANTYHLLLRPGTEILDAVGGVHGLTGSNLPILTDSGGYQIMSLAKFREITDAGAKFRSHLDGREIHLTPEEAVRIQNSIGSDIQMALDVCPAAGAPRPEVERSIALSLAWAERTLAAPVRACALRFGISQGGMDAALRAHSTRATASMAFDGFGIGGLSVGEPEDVMFEMLAATLPHLPEAKPRYLMGVGKPSQIFHAVREGVDLFDCVLPTRVARHGLLWTSRGALRVDNLVHARDLAPADPDCPCPACAKYSRAYLRHLLRVEDPLFLRLASLHNLTFLLGFMKRIRAWIEAGTLPEMAFDGDGLPRNG